VDYTKLRDQLRQTAARLLEYLKVEEPIEIGVTPLEFRRVWNDPEGMVEVVLEKVDRVLEELEEERRRKELEEERRRKELEEERRRREAERRKREEARRLVNEEKMKLACMRSLKPEELKRCLMVGLVKFEVLPRLEEHIKRLGDTTYKVEEISPGEGFVFIFGPEERKPWIEALFYILDIRDIFDVLGIRDTLLVLDPERRREEIRRREEEVIKLEEELKKHREEPKEESLVEVMRDREGELKKHREEPKEESLVEVMRDRIVPLLREVKWMDHVLGILTKAKPLVLESRAICIIQGWVSDKNRGILERKIRELREETGELLVVQYEEPSHDEEVPSDAPLALPPFLRSAFTLTSLRGWPSAHEVNPAWITILVFSFQFGMMFGDVGQGLVFLILGFILHRKYKKGMMSKLGVMFIPMGISAMVFGFLYGEVFLVEGLLPPLLLSPMENVGRLMKLVLGIAVVELVFGLILSIINSIKSGHVLGALGEHGLGFILSIVGLYFGAQYFLRTGDIFALFSHWSFFMIIAGLILSFIEPVLSSLTVHKKLGFEAFGEGMGGLLMVFVESLANFFSFLRIAAFALAHASLAIAAHSMTHFMGPGGIILMNLIGMTFEFISSSVQSLRLLYYEFMGKFFHGGGIPFKPFQLKTQQVK